MKTFFAALFGAFIGTLMALTLTGFMLVAVAGVVGAKIKHAIEKVEAQHGGSGQWGQLTQTLDQLKRASQEFQASLPADAVSTE